MQGCVVVSFELFATRGGVLQVGAGVFVVVVGVAGGAGRLYMLIWCCRWRYRWLRDARAGVDGRGVGWVPRVQGTQVG